MDASRRHDSRIVHQHCTHTKCLAQCCHRLINLCFIPNIRAECYRLARHVAFVRAEAYHAEPRHDVAASVATFMIFSEGHSVLTDLMK